MKLLLALTMVLTTVTATACTPDDGVPDITDPAKIMVDGQPMTATAFHDRYCKVKPNNGVCIAVKQQIDAEILARHARRSTPAPKI